MLLFGGYISLYAVHSAALERYATGFVINTCPACGDGQLELDERPYRVLGIPRLRRTVRCDNCPSTLREVGRRRWRYTVDPRANPALFERYNGSVLNDQALLTLAEDTAQAPSPPAYIEDET